MKTNGWQMSPTLEFLFKSYSAAIHCLCQKSGLGFLGMLLYVISLILIGLNYTHVHHNQQPLTKFERILRY